eukprot:gb/GECG01009299.1/.p1 GENE.gb/GECG01009299.1/~~gb/GECG01009299.1/.p1  ORF type:complete len:378 (+),score=47.72 gb/GECG01009299.1/:1-1134(+)
MKRNRTEAGGRGYESFSGANVDDALPREKALLTTTQRGTGRRRRTDKERQNHNQAEQKRAGRIRNKIEELENTLTAAGKETKRDRASVLSSAVSYINELEERVDRMHQDSNGSYGALADACMLPIRILKVDIIIAVADTKFSSNAASGIYGEAYSATSSTSSAQQHYLNYKSLFLTDGLPKAIVSLDGIILDCNAMLCWFTGYSRAELLQMSFFSLMPTPEAESTKEAVKGLSANVVDWDSEVVCCSMSYRKQFILKEGVAQVYTSLSMGCDEEQIPHFDSQHFVCTILPLIYPELRKRSLFCIDIDGRLLQPSLSEDTAPGECSLRFADRTCSFLESQAQRGQHLSQALAPAPRTATDGTSLVLSHNPLDSDYSPD